MTPPDTSYPLIVNTLQFPIIPTMIDNGTAKIYSFSSIFLLPMQLALRTLQRNAIHVLKFKEGATTVQEHVLNQMLNRPSSTYSVMLILNKNNVHNTNLNACKLMHYLYGHRVNSM